MLCSVTPRLRSGCIFYSGCMFYSGQVSIFNFLILCFELCRETNHPFYTSFFCSIHSDSNKKGVPLSSTLLSLLWGAIVSCAYHDESHGLSGSPASSSRMCTPRMYLHHGCIYTTDVSTPRMCLNHGCEHHGCVCTTDVSATTTEVVAYKRVRRVVA